MKEKITINKLLFAFNNKAKMTNRENEYIYFTKNCQYVTNGNSLLLIDKINTRLNSDIVINRDNLAYALIGRKLEFEFSRDNCESSDTMYFRFKDFQDVIYNNLLFVRKQVLNLDNIVKGDFKFLFSFNLNELSNYNFTSLMLSTNLLSLYDYENNQYVFERKIDFKLNNLDVRFNWDMCSFMYLTEAVFYFDYENNILLIKQDKDKTSLYIKTENEA